MNTTRAPLGVGFSLLVVAAMVTPVSAAWAQVERSGGGVNAQLAQQYQQAVAERTQLQADNSKLKKDLDDAKQQLKEAQRQLAQLRASATGSQSALAAAQAASQSSAQSLEQSKARMQELVDRFRETIATLKAVEAERGKLQLQLAQANSAYDASAQRNVQLYQANIELLDRYQHEGMFEHVAKAEPFTRIERTRMDNLVLEDKQRVDELREQRQPTSAGGLQTGSAPGATAPPPAPADRPQEALAPAPGEH